MYLFMTGSARPMRTIYAGVAGSIRVVMMVTNMISENWSDHDYRTYALIQLSLVWMTAQSSSKAAEILNVPLSDFMDFSMKVLNIYERK